MLESFDNLAGLALSPVIPGPTRGLFSNQVLTARELEDSKFGLLTSAIAPLAAGARVAAVNTIDTSLVRFSQDSIKGTFKNGTLLNDAIDALRVGGAEAAAKFPPIRLFERNGLLFTLDNRRLLVFSQAGQRVPFRAATPAEIAAETTGRFSKFTTTEAQGSGQFITIRGLP